MKMELGDDGAMGPLWLGYYKHQTASFSYSTSAANVTRAMRASPAPAYDARVHSLRTGARQRCACVFLVFKHESYHSVESWPQHQGGGRQWNRILPSWCDCTYPVPPQEKGYSFSGRSNEARIAYWLGDHCTSHLGCCWETDDERSWIQGTILLLLQDMGRRYWYCC